MNGNVLFVTSAWSSSFKASGRQISLVPYAWTTLQMWKWQQWTVTKPWRSSLNMTTHSARSLELWCRSGFTYDTEMITRLSEIQKENLNTWSHVKLLMTVQICFIASLITCCLMHGIFSWLLKYIWVLIEPFWCDAVGINLLARATRVSLFSLFPSVLCSTLPSVDRGGCVFITSVWTAALSCLNSTKAVRQTPSSTSSPSQVTALPTLTRVCMKTSCSCYRFTSRCNLMLM